MQENRWVSSAELCAKFGVKERQFRQVKGKPGLCSAFAVSGNKGFKHFTLASTSEWLRHKLRIKRNAIGQLCRIRDQQCQRANLSRRRQNHLFEKDSGQALLFEVAS